MMNELQPQSSEPFVMTEPGEYGHRTRYAFWFVSENPNWFIFLADLPCVYDVIPAENDEQRCLVEIQDTYDPDEAWCWIRTDLQTELDDVKLDNIWYEAIKWIL